MYKRGKHWITDFVYEGERHIKSWGEMNKSAAQAREDKFKTNIREGKHLKKSKQIKFEKFADDYLEAAEQNKKPSSVVRNRTSINALMPTFKGKLIQKIHPFEVEKYKKKRRDAGKAPATVNREIETLKNMMTVAVEWGYLQSNPIKSVKKYKLNNERDWILDSDQEQKLLEECDKRPQNKGGKYLRDLVEFALPA